MLINNTIYSFIYLLMVLLLFIRGYKYRFAPNRNKLFIIVFSSLSIFGSTILGGDRYIPISDNIKIIAQYTSLLFMAMALGISFLKKS